MKTSRFLPLLTVFSFLLSAFTLSAKSEMVSDSTGLPGDNFSLEAALELFKKSSSPEDFEKRLNTENNDVNNLDLNSDGKVDYIRVVDNSEKDVHALVLQVGVNEKESQDVAVIEIEKQGNENAILQIIGDEDLYGKQVIAEPFEEEKSNNGKNKGPAASSAKVVVVVNVWFWAPVRFMYGPHYVVYVSPYHYGVYPVYYHPWYPVPYHAFYVRVTPYHAHCHVVTTHRVVHAHGVYAPHRSHSTIVHTRTTTIVTSRNHHGPTTAKKTTTKTTHHNGTTTHSKTTTTAVKKGNNGAPAPKKTAPKTKGGRGH